MSAWTRKGTGRWWRWVQNKQPTTCSLWRPGGGVLVASGLLRCCELLRPFLWSFTCARLRMPLLYSIGNRPDLKAADLGPPQSVRTSDPLPTRPSHPSLPKPDGTSKQQGPRASVGNAETTGPQNQPPAGKTATGPTKVLWMIPMMSLAKSSIEMVLTSVPDAGRWSQSYYLYLAFFYLPLSLS